MVLTMHSKPGWLVVAAVAVLVSGVLGWQQVLELGLRSELGVRRVECEQAGQLRCENTRLRRIARDAGAATEDHALGQAQARTELAAVRVRLENAKRAEPPPGVREHFAVGAIIPAAEWRNVGHATPRATLEAVLWAAAGGDVDTFTNNLLLLDSAVRTTAQVLLDDRLPA